MLHLSFTGSEFVARGDSTTIIRQAGFKWSGARNKWTTTSHQAAARLRAYADPSARNELTRVMIVNEPWSGPLPFPRGLNPYGFQLNPSVRFALNRNRSYLALDPGLGKTVIAAIVRNARGGSAVYIAPPFLTRNVEAEFRKWSTTKDLKIVRYDTKEAPIERPNILIIPDTLIHREGVREEIADLIARDWDFLPAQLFVDEAHRYKNFSARRTQALLGLEDEQGGGIVHQFEHVTYLSGTPMPNGRPMELFPILSKSAPETIDFRTKHKYGMYFCGGYWDGYDYDFSGASHMDELERNVKGKFMLRLKKKDVLKSLPPKVEELVIIGNRPAKLIRMESKILAACSPTDLVAGKVSSEHVSTYRRELGKIKVKPAVDFLRSLLEDSQESLLVFAYHTDVIAELSRRLAKYSPLVITGKTPQGERHRLVKKFQTNKGRSLLIGNYQACGVGVTLTRATRVVFVEFSFVPSDNDQASDRAHRIGQRDSVLVQYLIYENSIDRKVMEINFKKKRTINYI